MWFSPGDHVAACDVSNSSCEEGHDNPREERVLHFTGRERGQSVHQLSLLRCICLLSLFWCPLWFTSKLFCSWFISLKVFNVLTFLPETQDPVIAAQDPTGGKSSFRNSFRITLLSFYSAKIFLLTGSFVVTFFAHLCCRTSWIKCAQTLFWTWIWRKAV